jgi:hypothetical protein
VVFDLSSFNLVEVESKGHFFTQDIDPVVREVHGSSEMEGICRQTFDVKVGSDPNMDSFEATSPPRLLFENLGKQLIVYVYVASNKDVCSRFSQATENFGKSNLTGREIQACE